MKKIVRGLYNPIQKGLCTVSYCGWTIFTMLCVFRGEDNHTQNKDREGMD